MRNILPNIWHLGQKHPAEGKAYGEVRNQGVETDASASQYPLGVLKQKRGLNERYLTLSVFGPSSRPKETQKGVPALNIPSRPTCF